jgi:hypothetical protein
MRDLGVMGEAIFSFWCASAGLTSNPSRIDKTGWDFLVEFPLSEDPKVIHDSAIECKIQVKSTDKNNRSVQIPLSNLRRLITAQMPAFLLFIEFDGMDTPQRVFVVHVDNDLISKILEKLHIVNQSDKENKFNKRKMSIKYDESHMIAFPNCECLKKTLLHHIGNNMAEYVANKKAHLASTGFENGFAKISFSIDNEDNLKKLADLSIGIGKSVDIINFRGVNTRFDTMDKSPFAAWDTVKMEMPNLEPTTYGEIIFKENKTSLGLSFISRLYISPFIANLPEELWQMRIEGDFFDLVFSPSSGVANYCFRFRDGFRLEVKKFYNAIKLIYLLCSSENPLFAELRFDGMPNTEFQIGTSDKYFDYLQELSTLESAIKIISKFDITEDINISLEEIAMYSDSIFSMENILELKHKSNEFNAEFTVLEKDFNPNQKVACLFLLFSRIGSHVLGAIVVATGSVNKIKDERFHFISEEVFLERKIASRNNNPINNEDLQKEIHDVNKKYEVDHSVVRLLN